MDFSKIKNAHDSTEITRAYFDQILVESRYLDSRTPDLSMELYGEKFSSPVMIAAFSHLYKNHPGGMVEMAKGAYERKVARNDVTVYYIPATKMANEAGSPTLANMILVGKLLEIFGEYNEETVKAALGKCISARHRDLFDLNLSAMEIGRKFK